MRSIVPVVAALTLALPLTACGSSEAKSPQAGSTPAENTQTKSAPTEYSGSGNPQGLWIAEVKAAGFEVKEGLTYENMFGRAELFCDVESKAQLAQLARMALSSEEGASMTAPGKDADVAAQRYADATWKYACKK